MVGKEITVQGWYRRSPMDDMMDQIVDGSLERFKEVDMSDNQKRLLSEKIGIGSLRYNVLKVQPEKGFTKITSRYCVMSNLLSHIPIQIIVIGFRNYIRFIHFLSL